MVSPEAPPTLGRIWLAVIPSVFGNSLLIGLVSAVGVTSIPDAMGGGSEAKEALPRALLFTSNAGGASETVSEYRLLIDCHSFPHANAVYIIDTSQSINAKKYY